MYQESDDLDGYRRFLTEKLSPFIYEKFNKSIRPIYVALENGVIEHIGSATLLRINGIRFLVTAAHVFDHFERGKLLISIANKVQLIHPVFFLSNKVNGDRDQDHLDFAVQCMEEEWYGSNIKSQEFISDSDIILHHTPILDGPHMCIGYPNSKNKLTRKVDKVFKTKILSYVGHSYLDQDIYNRVNCNTRSHLLIEYSDKKRYDDKFKKTGPISAKGLSGGVVIMMGINQESDEIFNSQALGIVIEHKKSERALVCIRFSEIFRRIALLKNEMNSSNESRSE